MNNQILTLFKGTHEDMCDSVILGWQNQKLNIKAFSSKDLKYTEAYADAAIAEAVAAKKLPDVSVRRAAPVNVKDIMKTDADLGISNYLVLIGFIEKIWPAAQVPAVKNIAGFANYKSALSYNWNAISKMLGAGNTFIGDNLDTLLNDGKGMLPGFPVDYTTVQTKYEDLYGKYILARQGVTVQTTGKITALNNVYSKFKSMSGDARTYFRHDKTTRDLFSYSKLYEKVAGAKQGGFHISVKSEGDKLPVDTTTITFMPGKKTFYANEEGIINAILKEGEYTYVATTPGYEMLQGKWTATKNVVHRKEFILKKMDDSKTA